MRSGALILLAVGTAALAQAGDAPPADATTPDPQQLRSTVAGHSFNWQSAHTKVTARVQYNDNGYAFINLSTGLNDSGKWRVEGPALCAQWEKLPSGCSAARIAGTTLWVQRNDGTWAWMSPR
jgi:hypothetical protein